MRTVTLKEGVKVPVFGLGTWRMGERRSQRPAEVAHPDVIHRDTCRKRIRAIRKPAGEGEPTPAATLWVSRNRTLGVLRPCWLFRVRFGAGERFLGFRDFLSGFWFART